MTEARERIVWVPPRAAAALTRIRAEWQTKEGGVVPYGRIVEAALLELDARLKRPGETLRLREPVRRRKRRQRAKAAA